MPLPPAPHTARENVVDELHGARIVDPYRWLEADAAEPVRDWTDEQNARTRAVLDAIPQRAAFAKRLRELLSVGLLSTPRPIAGRIFHTRREGTQKQAVLYVRDGVRAPDRALIDPNALDPDGLVTLDWYYPSLDARYVAYGLSRGGDEMSTLHVADVATGKDLADRIPHTQRSTVAWVQGGFYYTVHPAPGSVAPGDENYYRRVRYHRLGDDPAKDELIFGEGRPKEEILGVSASADGRWVLLTAFKGWASSDLYLLDRTRPEQGLAVVLEGKDAIAEGFVLEGRVWLRTNLDAPNYRVVSVACESPEASRWETVIAEGPNVIEGFDRTRDRIAVVRLVRATSRLTTYDLRGRDERDVALPSLGTIEFVDGEHDGDRIGYTFQSFTQPPIAFVANAHDGKVDEVVRLRMPDGLDVESIVVEQTAYTSRDGTEVTMFLVHRKDVRPKGRPVATVLTGYGGFNISRTPMYSAGAAAWVEAGGLFALPNLRGGGEYGETWHKAGMLANKQNVFDDFHAAAEALIAAGWTDPEHLAISGGSNGGLLVGAALTQRPELFAAVCCAVPLLDMLRYQNFRIARFWIAEYGSAEDAEQAAWLRKYSPYHNVRAGVRYPPVLFTTADGDSRVDPMHARKMAALLQAQSEDPDSVVLLRVDRDAGHGIGKPLDKQVDDFADQYAFIAWRTGLQLNRPGMLASR